MERPNWQCRQPMIQPGRMGCVEQLPGGLSDFFLHQTSTLCMIWALTRRTMGTPTVMNDANSCLSLKLVGDRIQIYVPPPSFSISPLEETKKKNPTDRPFIRQRMETVQRIGIPLLISPNVVDPSGEIFADIVALQCLRESRQLYLNRRGIETSVHVGL